MAAPGNGVFFFFFCKIHLQMEDLETKPYFRKPPFKDNNNFEKVKSSMAIWLAWLCEITRG